MDRSLYVSCSGPKQLNFCVKVGSMTTFKSAYKYCTGCKQYGRNQHAGSKTSHAELHCPPAGMLVADILLLSHAPSLGKRFLAQEVGLSIFYKLSQLINSRASSANH